MPEESRSVDSMPELERCRQGIIEQHDFEVMRKDGTPIYAILETSPLSDENGNYTGALGCVTNITKRKQAEQALKDNVEVLAALEKTYSIIVESAAEGILILNTETKRFKYANPAIIRMLGYSQEEFKEMAMGDLNPKNLPNHIFSQFNAQVDCLKGLLLSLYYFRVLLFFVERLHPKLL